MVVTSGGEGLLEPVDKVPGAAEHPTMDRTTETLWSPYHSGGAPQIGRSWGRVVSSLPVRAPDSRDWAPSLSLRTSQD